MFYLTELEMLKVIIEHLKIYYSETKSKDASIIINSLIRYKDSAPAMDDDAIIWKDWQDTVNLFKVKVKGNLFSESEAFDAFEGFLVKYYERTKSDDMGAFLGDLLHGDYGYTSDPAAAYDWQECLLKIKGQ
jgi:hypothetical protein